MQKEVYFERAIFLSWYCSKGDCKFCYMSTQKNRIENPRLARRRIESILAEAVISRACNWREEFLSGGFDSYELDEIVDIAKKVHQITGRKQWLNIGDLKKEEIMKFLPYIQGVSGAVECTNPELRKRICPSKPIQPILDMYRYSRELGLKNSVTIIIGLGETIDDFENLKNLIEEHNMDRITFYALNPHKETGYNEGPKTEYYIRWIEKTRKTFPDIEIVAGSWVDRLSEIHQLIEAGADHITKFPSIRLFNTKYARQIEHEVNASGNRLISNLTQAPQEKLITSLIGGLDMDDELKQKIMDKAYMYLKKMVKNGNKQ